MSAYEITVFGLVQGIGFRAFVAEYAEKNGLVGSIKNSGGVCRLYIECDQEAIGKLTYYLRYNCPKEGRVDNILVKPVDQIVYDEEVSEIQKGLEESAKRVKEIEQAVEAVEAERLGESIGEILLEEKKKKEEKKEKEEKEKNKAEKTEAEKQELEGESDEQSDEDVAEGVVLDQYGRELDDSFRIIRSDSYDEDVRYISPDIPTCPRCEKELLDPNNRRYRYPFISCNECGPRYSIIKTIPYDRENSTMDDFYMCQDCAREYHEPGNPRRFEQTISCKDCGPKLRYYENRMVDEVYMSQDEILDKTVESLKAGKIGAIKGIGGFRFVFVPSMSEPAVRLRDFKDNVNNPFSILFPNIDEIKKYCYVSKKEEEVLLSSARPIVLLDRIPGVEGIAEEVLVGSDRIGAMLPSDPLQIILSNEIGPLVMTTGKRGGEPVSIDDMDMIKYLPGVDGTAITTGEVSAVAFADDNINKEETTYTGRPDEDSEAGLDFMLTNTREIVSPLEDSLVQVVKIHVGNRVKEEVQIIRRARGYVPGPVMLDEELPKETFAAGGDGKAVFALAKKNAVYLSENFGSLVNSESIDIRNSAIEHMEEILNISPKRFIGDLNPNYISSKDADSRALSVYIDGIPQRVFRRQHHASHILSVAAEHGLKGRLLGVAYDGVGYGTDDTIWGSEIISCMLSNAADEDEMATPYLVEKKPKMIRSGALLPVKLMGGDQNYKDVKTTLCGYFKSIEERQLVPAGVLDKVLRILNIDKGDYGIICACLRADINTYYSASMGRLFDAVTALLGVRARNTFDGESPIALECAAAKAFKKQKDVSFETKENELKLRVIEPRDDEEIYRFDQAVLVADIMNRVVEIYERHPDIDELEEAIDNLALEFHKAVVESTVYICDMVCGRDYIQHIALSGGSMYNRLLVDGIAGSLERLGYGVYINNQVPNGDGGIALGQIYGEIL